MFTRNLSAQDILLYIIIFTSVVIFMTEFVYLIYLLSSSCFYCEYRFQLPKAFVHFIWIKTTIIFLTIAIYPSISGTSLVYIILIFLFSWYSSGIDQIRFVSKRLGFFVFFFAAQCVIYCIVMYVRIVKDVQNIGFITYLESEHALKTIVGVGCPSMLLFISCLFLLIESSFMYGHVHQLAVLASVNERAIREQLAVAKEEKEELRIYNTSAEQYYIQHERNNVHLPAEVNTMESPYPWSNGSGNSKN